MIIAYASRSNLSVALVDAGLHQGVRPVEHRSRRAELGVLLGVHGPADSGRLGRRPVRREVALRPQLPVLVRSRRRPRRWPGTVAALIALRIMLGVGESVVAPASYKWIRMNFDESQRGLAVGLYMTGTKIGPAIGTPLAAWLIAIVRLADDVRADRPGRPRVAGALALARQRRSPLVARRRCRARSRRRRRSRSAASWPAPSSGARSSRRSATCTSSTSA